MDDNSGNTTDKRNWRERLGIGKTPSTADMPKLSSDFKPVASEPTKSVQAGTGVDKAATYKPVPHAPAKSAPMAPRATPRPVAVAPVKAAPQAMKPIGPAPSQQPAPARVMAPRTPPLATDALANKLKDQRDAAERLALQRVQAAKHKAEANLQAGGATAKPKFSFADESSSINAAAPASQAAARPATTPSYAAAPTQPNASPHQQIQPPRPQLGGGGFGSPPSFKPQGQGYVPPGNYQQPPFQQNYGFQQPPAYRPIDPNTGYAPPPTQPPPMRQLLQSTMAQPAQRRPQTQLQGQASEPRAPIAPRGPQVSLGPAVTRSATNDDIFEPAPARGPGRRATANEYQKAYRDEIGYEDEAPRSRILITLLSFLGLSLLVAFAAVYGYAHYFKNQRAATANGAVPVVAAPATPTKVTPDPATPGPADASTKKQIYDRIEGDHEVPGGPLKSTEEAPTIQPGAAKGTAPAVQAPKASGATDGTPLPLPPPPGGGGTGQQGSLAADDKTDVATITPAAEHSSAALSSSPAASAASPGSQTNVDPSASQLALPLPDPPPSAAPPETKLPSTAASAADTSIETIAAIKPTANKPTPLASGASQNEQPQVPVKKADKLKNLVLGKSMGAKPLVLVPPSKLATRNQFKLASAQPTPLITSGGNSLYGDVAPQVAIPATPKAPTPPALNPAPKLVVTPVPQATPAGNGYVAQLASFNSKTEANAEYQRLSAKHGPIISRYAPIITQAQIAGSTRYKLNLGPMATNDAASSVCSALISAGERDCVVRHQ